MSKYILFVLAPSHAVFTNALNVLATSSLAAIAILQSDAHVEWALKHCSTLESRTRYNPTDCFETFPFPDGFAADRRLEAAGRAYYEFRAALMVRTNEGLTKTYNRFHDPDEREPDILTLRELHASMDRAVLDAYGWSDIQPTCEFELEWEDDEADNGRPRRKPWRYRWPEPVRDEVLARLLALNAQRAEEERLTFGDR